MPAILKTVPAPRDLDIAQAMAWVRQTYGKGRIRQFAEIAGLVLSRQKALPKDYYFYGLFRPEIGPEQRRAYVFNRSGRALNGRLSPRHPGSLSNLLHDKALLGLLLERAGLPVMPILAIHGQHLKVPAVRHLGDAAAIAAFLGDVANLPCFGKPIRGSLGLGAVGVASGEDGGRRLTLTDGRIVDAAALAEEIARTYPDGYMFQPLIRQHPVLEACNGTAVGMLRVVTLRLAEAPRLLYAVQRLPPDGAMSDGATGHPNTMALVDPATGRIVRAQALTRMATSPATHSPARGVPLDTLVVPFVDRAVAVALDAHRLFPASGILGFDIAIRPDGPVINEINGSPFHHIYQRPADRGLLNPDFKPMIDEAIAVSAEMERMARRLTRPAA
jgi:hypothetical protein